MAPLLPQDRHSLDQWLRRLDRAAFRMNPYLTVLMIGLIVLNLTCLALMAMHLPVVHDPMGLSYCQPAFDCTGGLPQH